MLTLIVMIYMIQIVSGVAYIGRAWQDPGPPKCLLCTATYIAKDQGTLIEQSIFY